MELSERVRDLDPEHLVFGGVFAVANRLQRTLDSLLPGLTAKQWWLLVILSLFEEPPTISELARTADTSHQNTRQLLDRLEEKGFVHLLPDSQDARALRVHSDGRVAEWGQETAGQAQEFMEAMYSRLSREDLAQLGRSLLAVHTALGELERHGAGPHTVSARGTDTTPALTTTSGRPS